MGRKRRNNVYRHYMLQEEFQTSTCLLCYKTLNSTHGSNLMNHLKFMHKIEYQQILALNNGTVAASPPRVSPNSNDEDSNQSDPGLEVDVDKFFTKERGTGRARCEICQASVDMKGGSLMTHLKRQHPKILKPSNDESDVEDQDDNLYQEVVYLYDSDSKSPKNVRAGKLESSTPMHKQKMKQKMNHFNRPSTSIENRKRRRTQEIAATQVTEESNEELENFGKYVTCLMKTVPTDLCTQLQMDIINLIMTAKIKNMSKSEASSSIIVEKLDSAVGSLTQHILVNEDANSSTSPTPESNTEELVKFESLN